MSLCMKCNKNDTATEFNTKCGHNVCHKCLCDILKSFSSAKINCPVEGCTKVINDKVVRKCLSNEKIALYNKLSCGQKVVKCLVEDCDNVVALSDNGGQFVCQKCEQPNCFNCKKLHDLNQHCDSIKEYCPKTFNDAALKRLRRNRLQRLKSVSKEDLIPNSDSFACEICSEFVLPREGISLRNCMHSFCKSCLEGNFKASENLQSLSCLLSECSVPISEREAAKFIGREQLQMLSLKNVKPRVFNCQTPDCKGLWDFASFTGKYNCPRCKETHCGSCQNRHKNLTCAQFRETKLYKDSLIAIQRLQTESNINCAKCGVLIIKKGGCNALRCPNCQLQVCAFSGKEIGPRGCQCKQNKRCHASCSPGCIPDGNTPYEKELKKYFYAP